MMLVMEVVTTALLLVTVAAAQKPSILADASIDVSEQATENGPLLGILMIMTENPPGKDFDYKKNEVFGKDLDSEENSEEEEEYDNNNNNEDDDDDDDDDDDSEESSKAEVEEEDDNDEESNDRFKRKVIFRGGGGGIYSRGGVRRGGGAGNDDPYGRRRGHQGPDYGPYESWPYRRPDTPFVEVPGTSGLNTKKKTDTAVYGTTRTTSSDTADKSSTSGMSAISGSSRSASSPTAATSAAYGISNASGRGDGRRTKTERRETSKTKLSKNLKWEIAQYALQHGAQRAAGHFEDRVGRKLRVKKVEKFMKRYQSKM